MARKKISEYRAKVLLYHQLHLPYSGIRHSTHEQATLPGDTNYTYVIKVDEGIKKRFKQQLVYLDQKASEIPGIIEQLQKNGYTQFLIEPFIPHEGSQERYLSLERYRDGIHLLYSANGGVDIESQKNSLQNYILTSNTDYYFLAEKLGILQNVLEGIVTVFEENHLTFLEINPFIIIDQRIFLLDAAVEVDSVAQFFVHGWSDRDFVTGRQERITQAEKEVEALAEKSQAAFSLTVLNPNGSIFVLLSGGGASIVLADEIGNLGYGKELANYGEYSGNPSEEETYLYTKSITSLLLNSQSPKKTLIIGGGVANFTDIRITFKGIIRALAKESEQLRKQDVKVYVRRGGPNQEEGLQMIKNFLAKEGFLGTVAGPEMLLTEIVHNALGGKYA